MRPKEGRLNENDTKTDPRRAWQQTQEYHSKIIITILKKKNKSASRFNYFYNDTTKFWKQFSHKNIFFKCFLILL